MNKRLTPSSKNAQTQQLLLALTALRQHGPLAFAVSMILAGIAMAAVVWFWEPVYQAKAFLRVKLNPDYTQILPDRNQAKTDVKSELAPITSDLVLGRVLLIEEIQKQPSFRGMKMSVGDLRSLVSYRSAGGPELFEVVATSRFPKEAQILTKVVTEQFLEYYRTELTDRINQLQTNLKTEMDAKLSEISNANKEINAMVEQMQKGVSTRDTTFDPNGTYLAELRKSRIALEVDLEILENESKKLSELIASETFPIDESLLRAQVESNPQIVSYREDIRLLEERRSFLTQKGAGHPESVKLDEQLKMAKKNLAEVLARIEKMARLQLLDQQQRLNKEKQAESSRELTILQTRLARLNDEIQRQNNTISINNRDQTELDNKVRERDRIEQNYEELRGASDTLRLRNLSVQYLIAQQNETVELPSEPVERYPFKLIGIAALAGFAFPFGLALLWEMRVRRISNVHQLGQNMTTPVVGEVATLPAMNFSSSKTVSRRMTKQLRLYQESVDNISTMLFVDKEKIPSTLAVTSAASNEGKTTLSSQLALSIARSSHGRVLLIDCDLRSPSQHRLFDLDLDPGVAEVLEQKMSWSEVVKKSRVDNLDILTAGRVKSSPRRCFSNHGWDDLLHEVQQDYDFVIIDTPPILATSEATIICKSCEATIMCTLRDFSRADSVQRAEERLQSASVNVIGFVLGGVPQSEYANRYGTYGYVLN